MEKRKEKSDLEQLLNSLIEKGWDVFPDKKFFGNKDKLRFSKGKKCVWFGNDDYTLRELTSKESGLWQFVCEMSAYNNYNKEKGKVLTWKKFEDDKYQINGYSNGGGYIQDYEYRLIESSLKDESELEDFLLSNIKVEGIS